MKKTITFITVMLIATAAFTGCNSSSNNSNSLNKSNSSSSSEKATEAPTDSEKIVVDPFEGIEYTEHTDLSMYPQQTFLNFDVTNTLFGNELIFKFTVDSCTKDEVVVKAELDMETLNEVLENSKYTVDEYEKEIHIKVSDLNSRLISVEQLTTEIKDVISNGMINTLGNSDTFSLQKMYAVIPQDDTFPIDCVPQESAIYTDDNGVLHNVSSVTFRSNIGFNTYLFGIIKDNNENYYCVTTPVSFIDGKLNDKSLDYYHNPTFIDGMRVSIFEDEKSAYECGTLKSYGNTEQPNEYYGDSNDTISQVAEIPLS